MLKDALVFEQEFPDCAVKEIAEAFPLVLGVFLRFY